MIKSFTIRRALTLLALVVSFSSFAQETTSSETPPALDLKALENGWWSHFEVGQADAAVRIERFLASQEEAIAALPASEQALANSILKADGDNLTAYLALLDEPEIVAQELPEPKLSYTLDEWLALAEDSRDASKKAAIAEDEIEREQRILDGASRRRDLSFKGYVNATADDEKVLAALRLVQNRSAQAIAERRVTLLSDRFERARHFSDALVTRVEYATERLAVTPESADLESLLTQIAAAQEAITANDERLREANLATAAIDTDSEMGRSQQHLAQQKQIDAQVDLALAQIALEKLKARRWWTELQLASAGNLDKLNDEILQRSELVRSIQEQLPVWREETQSELLATQTVPDEERSRAAQRLLDQRSGTAQVALYRLLALETEIADLELLGQAVDNTVSEYSGAFRSWLGRLGRNVKATYRRALEIGDTRLFSVGDAPVTGAGIVRVFLIMLIAFLLSRGLRHTLARVSRSESSGTQASLYTVGRLTHYTIIVVAMLIALSSIGLNFSSFALVAGALGIGIGFGLQAIVSNFVSGLIILFEHTLRVGDYIELDAGLTGTVKSINVRSTLIRTNDNIDIVVPNSEFVTTRLTNWTLGEHLLRVRIPFGVAYGSDKELVRKAAIEAAGEVTYTLSHMRGREPDVWLVNFGDSSLDFLLLVWVNRQGASRPTRTRAAYLWALETKLSEYGIEIPFPQRDLNLRAGWTGLSAAPSGASDADIKSSDE